MLGTSSHVAAPTAKLRQAELKRAQGIGSARSRWLVQSVSLPPPPHSSLSPASPPARLILVFADFLPMTFQTFLKEGPHHPLHTSPYFQPKGRLSVQSRRLIR